MPCIIDYIRERNADGEHPFLEEIRELVEKADNPAKELSLKRGDLISRYAFAIPTDDVIAVVAGHSPLVEVGAGNGYWAWCLDRAGADVIALDRYSPDSQEYGSWFGGNQWFDDTWYLVEEGDSLAASLYPDRSLFLCWPPLDDPMAVDALRYYRDAGGQTLLYIGSPRHCGDRDFHRKLAGLTLLESSPVWSWPGLEDSLYIYSLN